MKVAEAKELKKRIERILGNLVNVKSEPHTLEFRVLKSGTELVITLHCRIGGR